MKDEKKPKRYDWHALRAEFVASTMTLSVFAAAKKIDPTTVYKRASAEGWIATRDESRGRLTDKIIRRNEDAGARTESEIDKPAHDAAISAMDMAKDLIGQAETAQDLKAAVDSLEKAYRIARSSARLTPEPTPKLEGFDPSLLTPDEQRTLKKLATKASGGASAEEVH